MPVSASASAFATPWRVLATAALLALCVLPSAVPAGAAATAAVPRPLDEPAVHAVAAPMPRPAADTPAGPAPTAATPVFVAPLADFRLSSPFGSRRHPIRGRSHRHSGADLAVPRGTGVRVVADGTVTAIRTLRTGYGRHVVVDHGAGYSSWYAHLDSVEATLRVGDAIPGGTRIGAAGSTGSATGPHLHLEIRLDDVPVEPMALLHPAPVSAPAVIGIAPAWRANAAPP